jgi:hypothetical protein
VANVVVSAVSTYNNKGLKQAKKELTAFEKQTQALGRTFRRVFALTALTAYSKKAINAFAADEKAAKSLEMQLKNTGYAFSAPGVELYIANLQKATGVLDDQLRPAFQQLLTVTGSITQSQEALNTALNVAAATGRSVAEVSAAIAKGYTGQTSALTRLGVGLSKATLKTGDMDKILGELNDKFAGQAAARLDTYAGKMDQLRVASANAAEVIGKSLLDSISNISKGGTISSLATQIEDVANSVSYLIRGVGELTKELKGLAGVKIPTPGGGSFLDFILRNAPIISSYYSAGKRAAGAAAASRPAADTPAEGRILAAQRRQEARNIKEINRLRTQEIAKLKEKTAVDKLKDQFDIERIGLTKALNEATDAETKLRLQAQIAILDNNEALAKKILAELAAAEAAKKLAATYDQALESVKLMNARIAAFLTEMATKGYTVPGATKTGGAVTYDTALAVVRSTNNRIENFLDQFKSTSSAAQVIEEAGVVGPNFNAGRFRMGEERSMQDVNITVDVAQSGDKFAALIAESIQVATKSGISYGVAGGL